MILTALNPRMWGIIAAGLAVAGAIWYTFNQGVTVGEANARAECQENVERYRKQIEQIRDEHAAAFERQRNRLTEQQAQAVDRARAFWEAEQESSKTTEIIEREVIKYVEKQVTGGDNCAADPEFLRIWNQANANKVDN